MGYYHDNAGALVYRSKNGVLYDLLEYVEDLVDEYEKKNGISK